MRASSDEEALRRLLDQELSAVYGTAETILTKMQVNLTFKDVTYESLTNPEFVELARKAIPSLPDLHGSMTRPRQSQRLLRYCKVTCKPV